MSALVEARGLAAGYGAGPVLQGVDFTVEPGRSVCVLGPNGGGKTTLFRVLAGELEPVAGTAAVAGRPAYVVQTERTRLDFPVSALDVALMGTLAGGRWWLPPRRSDRRAAMHALERVGLADEASTRFGELSGGQRQRVLVARALVQDARVLLLDEPLSGVDPASAERIGRAALATSAARAGRCSCPPTTWRARGPTTSCSASTAHRWRSARRGPPSRARSWSAPTAASWWCSTRAGRAVRAVAVQHHEH